jgi:dinuclear metal center YbgI/SA1388 family protein
MITRNELVSYLDSFLNIEKFKDYGINGLQVEGRDKITHVGFAVSASLEVFSTAANIKTDMLVVHHGLFWQKPLAIKGYLKDRIKCLIENEINLLAYHLPLDNNIEIGNNIMIIKSLEAENIEPFGSCHLNFNKYIGFKGNLKTTVPFKSLVSTFESFNGKSLKIYGSPEKEIKSVGVVSGGAAELINEAVANNIDLYITGEVSEYVQEICRETGICFIAGGHYNTEKHGIIALQKSIEDKFRIKTSFIDIPNSI